MPDKETIIKKSRQGSYIIFSVNEAISAELAEKLEGNIKEAIDNGDVRIILDLSSVPFIDSKGLEMILDLSKDARKKGGSIKIADPSPICRDIFYATRIANTLEIYSDIESSRRSFL